MHGPTPKTISRNARSVKRPRRAPRLVVSTQAMNRLSNVTLSAEQEKLRERILSFMRSNLTQYKSDWKHPAMFVIQGDAGTGKSVILNSLFNEIQKLSQFSPSSEDILHGTHNYLVVNHPEMLKLYIRISDSFKYITKSSLERPTSLINSLQKKNAMADVVIVDEAHLLATSKDAFKRFYGENHLEDLMSLCKVLVLVYDDKQALRMGSYWDESSNNGASLKYFYNQIPPQSRDWYTLKQQFRVAAPQNVLHWIDQISVSGKIPPIESVLPKGETDGVDDKTKDFDFKIWDDCGAMYEAIKEKDRQYGQCRMLSTYDFPYRLDGKDYYVECGDNFKVRWDRYTPREVTPWSERGDTIDEVGSVYTIQGFDLNYAGVILGRSIGFDAANNCIKLRPELYDDRAGFTKKKNIHSADDVKQKIIMNSINVLLTRGVRGLYVYAYDPELREKLLRPSQK